MRGILKVVFFDGPAGTWPIPGTKVLQVVLERVEDVLLVREGGDLASGQSEKACARESSLNVIVDMLLHMVRKLCVVLMLVEVVVYMVAVNCH